MSTISEQLGHHGSSEVTLDIEESRQGDITVLFCRYVDNLASCRGYSHQEREPGFLLREIVVFFITRTSVRDALLFITQADYTIKKNIKA